MSIPTVQYKGFELRKGGKVLYLDRPKIMGVLNVTPDSFSDGGKYYDFEAAIRRAEEMIQEGVDIIDIGGESTGPGSKDVSLEEELERVIPVVKEIRAKFPEMWLSADTCKAEVAKQAIEAGCDTVNDIMALRGDNEMVHVVAEKKVPVVLMYSKESSPRLTAEAKEYDDIVKTIIGFLSERVQFAFSHGIAAEQIIIDPGMGVFVSSLAKYSLEILTRLKEFKSLGFPILIGPSRKSFIGEVLNVPVDDRPEGSLAAATVALLNGANIIRVHDVKACRRVADFVSAVQNVRK